MMNHPRTRLAAPCVLATAALLATALPAVAGTKHDARKLRAENYAELLTAPFKGKPPEYIARYFVHPNGFMAEHAMIAMKRQHGEKAVGLLLKLLKDDNPIMRYSAVHCLADIMLPPAKRGGGRRRADEPAPPGAEKLGRIIEPMAYDKHPAVQQAVADAFSRMSADTASIRRIALKMADSPDLTVRNMALRFGQQVIRDPNTQVAIGATVSGHMNIPRMWGHAHQLIARNMGNQAGRAGLPALIHFQAHVANTRPVRGMFSDSPQKAALEAMLGMWDAEVEKMPDAVLAVCRSFVRLPHNGHPGWVESRKASFDILNKMTQAAAPKIAEYVKAERVWLSRADDAQLRPFCETSTGREQLTVALDYLEYAGQCIGAGKPIEKQCPLRLDPEYKPEMPDLRLDNPDLRPMP